MKVEKNWLRKVLQDISTFGQLGFQVVCPPIILCLVALWASKRFGIGAWIIITAVVIGLMCAFISLYKICRFFLLKNTNPEEENRIISYREHI